MKSTEIQNDSLHTDLHYIESQPVRSTVIPIQEPIYIFVITLLSVFVAEFVVMMVLSLLPPLTLYKQAFLAAFLLSVVAYPILCLLVVRPLKRQIAERYQAETRFEQVAENAQEWIWEVDAKGLYLYASPIVERILGYTPAEIVGKKHFYDLFHPNEREERKAAAFKVLPKNTLFASSPTGMCIRRGMMFGSRPAVFL